jgi:hypothetical protein
MTEREGAAYHAAGRAVIAYLRNVYFEKINILADERHLSGLIGRNSQFPPPDDSEGTDTRSYADIVQIEIGLAGAFAEYLHVRGFTPGRDVPETYIRAMNACLECSEDDAAQRALAREVKHWNSSENLMDEVLSSPYARDILFDVCDHWHRVDAIATALVERGSLSKAEVHQIIQANEL